MKCVSTITLPNIIFLIFILFNLFILFNFIYNIFF
nr:MAG TPA: hypothetical protein [Caudoviricetes sp.]